MNPLPAPAWDHVFFHRPKLEKLHLHPLVDEILHDLEALLTTDPHNSMIIWME